MAMDEAENLPRPRGDAAQKLGSEDLDSYSIAEIDARIDLLRAEIARCEARRSFAAQHRISADALFRKG